MTKKNVKKKGGNPEYHVLARGFFPYVGINMKSLKHGILQVKSSKRGYSEVFPFKIKGR
jgi:hypothetical protein